MTNGRDTKLPGRGPWAEDSSGWFVAGYGPFRRLEGGASPAQRLTMSPGPVSRLASLFNEDVSLSEAVEWLKDLHLRQLEGREQAGERLGLVKDMLNDGLLPDGFRTALVLDLVRQVFSAEGDPALGYNADGTPVVRLPGVVLIDEIDVHLHVSWQKAVGGWLKRHFPRMQFIVSSHSPYICQSADPGGLIRLPGANEETAPHAVPEEFYQRVVFGSGDDALLTDLFGIDSPYSHQADEKRERLSELETRVLGGEVSPAETDEYVDLRRALTSSLTARVDEVSTRLGRN